MKKIIVTVMTLLAIQFVDAQELTKLWEVTTLEAPESAIYHDGFYYVSNVAGKPTEKNGLGYLSKIGMDGNVVEQKWVTGFNAPKGLGIYGSKLYVADIDVVAVVDLNTRKIEKTYQAEGATFLNDIEVATDGTVYISDTFGGNAIYQIKDDKISILIKDDELDYPNGLKIIDETLYVASWGVVTDPETFGTEVPGKIIALDLRSNSIKNLSAPIGNLDGLIKYKGGFLTSDWIAGSLLYVNKQGQAKQLLDLNRGSADIAYGKKQNILLIPQMMDGVLTAYQLR